MVVPELAHPLDPTASLWDPEDGGVQDCMGACSTNRSLSLHSSSDKLAGWLVRPSNGP
jgi:hypothetical protein